MITYQIGTSFLSTSRCVRFNSVSKYAELGRNKIHTSNVKTKTISAIIFKTVILSKVLK